MSIKCPQPSSPFPPLPGTWLKTCAPHAPAHRICSMVDLMGNPHGTGSSRVSSFHLRMILTNHFDISYIYIYIYICMYVLNRERERETHHYVISISINMCVCVLDIYLNIFTYVCMELYGIVWMCVCAYVYRLRIKCLSAPCFAGNRGTCWMFTVSSSTTCRGSLQIPSQSWRTAWAVPEIEPLNTPKVKEKSWEAPKIGSYTGLHMF